MGVPIYSKASAFNASITHQGASQNHSVGRRNICRKSTPVLNLKKPPLLPREYHLKLFPCTKLVDMLSILLDSFQHSLRVTQMW